MPSKIQLDENLWFLYICLQKSDMKSIDFTAVGVATSLKPPAARMRYTRLRRQIESGTLIGTHGTPFASPAVPEDEKKVVKKRKRTIKREEGKVADQEQQDEKKIKSEQSSSYSSSDTSDLETDSESEDEMPLAKLSKRLPRTLHLPVRDQFVGSGRSVGGVGGVGMGIGMGIGREEHMEQAELQALIPVGRVGLDSAGGWGGGEEVGGGFWRERYEREDMSGGGEGKPRMSI